MGKMIPTEEAEEQAKLFSRMMQTIVNEWDPSINSLKSRRQRKMHTQKLSNHSSHNKTFEKNEVQLQLLQILR